MFWIDLIGFDWIGATDTSCIDCGRERLLYLGTYISMSLETDLLFISWNLIMMMMMIMNYFCGMIDQQKTLSLNTSRDHCQKLSLSQISDTLQARLNLSRV